jgi:hypothetical protein
VVGGAVVGGAVVGGAVVGGDVVVLGGRTVVEGFSVVEVPAAARSSLRRPVLDSSVLSVTLPITPRTMKAAAAGAMIRAQRGQRR